MDSKLDASSYFERARLSAQRGHLSDAQASLKLGLALEPERSDAWAALGNVAHALGDLATAQTAFESVVAREPGAWKPLNDLAAVWIEMGEWERAAQALAQAVALSGDELTVTMNRATLATRRGLPREAVTLLREAQQKWPEAANVLAGLGFALRDALLLDEAQPLLERAHALAPENATAACGLGSVLLEMGRAEAALGVIQTFLQRRPGHSGALAVEALSEVALGNADAAHTLLDFERFVFTTEIPTPSGFSSLSEFNRALSAHVATHPTLFRAPTSHATAHGLHSGSLLVEPKGPVAALEAAVGAAITTYGRSLSAATPHPFVENRPRGVFLKMWSVVLERGGHQIPHIHPAAWISGVYYPQLPAALETGAGPAGWLEFGGSERPFPSKLELPVHRVRPRAGLLVLFPSYFFHRTVPFDFGGTRVSVAFDVVPA